jgi:hypothetical protein
MSRAKIARSSSGLSIDPARTAVIVVDMQNDFGTKGGMFDRAGVEIAPLIESVGGLKLAYIAVWVALGRRVSCQPPRNR